MDINKKQNQEELYLEVIGRLDTRTASQLENELKKIGPDIKLLTLDFTNLEYLTSVGIRILISANKMMTKQGELILKGLNSEVADVLEITGVYELFRIE